MNIDASRTIVLTRTGCGQCHATLRALDDRHIDYDAYDADAHPNLVEHARELGFTHAPVIIAPGLKPWSGFQPDRIAEITRSV